MNSVTLIEQMDTWFDRLIGQTAFYEVLMVALATVVLEFICYFMIKKAKKTMQKNPKLLWETAFFSALHTPLVFLVMVLGVLFIADVIRYYYANLKFLALAGSIRYLAIILFGAWFSWRFITELRTRYIQRIDLQQTKVDRTTVSSLSKLAKTLVLFFTLLMTLQTFNIKVSGILMFGGVGTAALAFAAKDLLANFFGGMIVYLDRPFKVGDWVRSPDRNIEGTVEDIGWRLTKIRTFDKRPLYVPNSVFNNISIENPSRMSNRRIYHKIGLRYQDAGKVSAILADVEAMLRSHPAIDTKQLLMAKLVEFAPSSLTFMVYTFTKTTKWVDFQEIQQDVFLKIIDIVLKHKAEFAFPSTTLYIPGEIKTVVN